MENILWEFRKLRGELKGSNEGWIRRVAVRSLPAAAFLLVGTGGLYMRKRRNPPEAQILGGLALEPSSSSSGRACFTCAATPGRGLPSAAEMQRTLEEAGAEDVAALRRAARRLRGPIERDLAAAERAAQLASDTNFEAVSAARRRIYAGLVENWRAAGYFREPQEAREPRVKQGVDLVTQMDESYGRDLCCEVPLCLLREGDDRENDEAGNGLRSLSVEDWEAAATALEAHGVVRLRQMVPVKLVEALRDLLGVQASVLDKRRADDQGLAPVRLYHTASVKELDPELEPVTSSPGRRHYHLRGSKLEEAVRHLQAGAMPLVWEHLMRTASAVGVASGGSLPYLSEVQLIVSEPCAADQFWHIDNKAGGITVFVPLTAVPEDMGPTHFLPGSHHFFEPQRSQLSRFGACAESLLSSEGVAIGAMQAGDALIYDSRIIHRGAANRRYDRTRMALIYRFDFERPPGIGALGTQFVAWTGGALAKLQRLYVALPGASPSSPVAAAAA
eukprot:TRINITY_DN9953_c0_g3_i1.p1 TRINITY_DN9953_c0_g3~~TRINITY_DN9953_c0_g3_i1.p1  ORF type:complete len:504 (-),score=98.24 TRINITY_DN9953_c0_g3_i1:245-1756(-)